ncbi:hypothetical protein [Novisyntrophococcus fermenticellae]|uniref:hypothetical protein n=1 Tax=Novisyntrophococcus fermenticellae TaxID=2068655 RepID=UPI001E2BF6F7|nr:hypothetical protein [Novisyntrophococcus fermenticellae]
MKRYVIQQMALLCLVSVIMILTNLIGYDMPLTDSIIGILVLDGIALCGLAISKYMSRFIHLPSMMYVSLTALLLACPISPVQAWIVETTSQVAFMAPVTALGAFAGISLSKDLKNFVKMGWKMVFITLLVISGTFIFSALVADVVLKLTHAV